MEFFHSDAHNFSNSRPCKARTFSPAMRAASMLYTSFHSFLSFMDNRKGVLSFTKVARLAGRRNIMDFERISNLCLYIGAGVIALGALSLFFLTTGPCMVLFALGIYIRCLGSYASAIAERDEKIERLKRRERRNRRR